MQLRLDFNLANNEDVVQRTTRASKTSDRSRTKDFETDAERDLYLIPPAQHPNTSRFWVNHHKITMCPDTCKELQTVILSTFTLQVLVLSTSSQESNTKVINTAAPSKLNKYRIFAKTFEKIFSYFNLRLGP